MKHSVRKVITLCGSVRFREDFEKEAERLTKLGHVILMPTAWVLFEDDLSAISEEYELKSLLMAIHRRKIEIADGIHIINKGSYIGKSTAEEIEHASKLGKRITLMEIGSM